MQLVVPYVNSIKVTYSLQYYLRLASLVCSTVLYCCSSYVIFSVEILSSFAVVEISIYKLRFQCVASNQVSFAELCLLVLVL